MIEAKILVHTKNPYTGVELITYQCTYHRFILPEVNTYRMISKNSASSRGIPITKRIEQVVTNPAMPVEWGMNQKGMVAYNTVPPETEEEACRLWREAAQKAVEYAYALNKLNIHKQLANRILEPFVWQTSVFTGNRQWFEHIFNQRIHPEAQPEFRELAKKMKEALDNSIPVRQNFHIPYILPQEKESLDIMTQAMVSVARCARVSYTPFNEETADVSKDLELYQRLKNAVPPHLSPFEHVAVAAHTTANFFNLCSFISFRWMMERPMEPEKFFR